MCVYVFFINYLFVAVGMFLPMMEMPALTAVVIGYAVPVRF